MTPRTRERRLPPNFRALPFLSLLLCAGCSWFVPLPPLDPLPRARVVLRDVAYVRQETHWDCGPACLATVMRYYGSRRSLAGLKRQLKRTRSGGTLLLEMVYGARRNGFRCRTPYRGGLNDLRRKLSEGKPLILMIHPLPEVFGLFGRRPAHYVVAVGYDDAEREVVLHSRDEAFATMSYRELYLQWRRTNFTTLLIERPVAGRGK